MVEQNNTTISDVREWLVRIDTNQAHQTKLLETLNKHSENAYIKADNAEELAQHAHSKVDQTEYKIMQTREDFERHKASEIVMRRWLSGLIVSSILVVIGLTIEVFI